MATEKLTLDVQAQTGKATAELTAFDAEVSAVARDRKANIDVKVDKKKVLKNVRASVAAAEKANSFNLTTKVSRQSLNRAAKEIEAKFAKEAFDISPTIDKDSVDQVSARLNAQLAKTLKRRLSIETDPANLARFKSQLQDLGRNTILDGKRSRVNVDLQLRRSTSANLEKRLEAIAAKSAVAMRAKIEAGLVKTKADVQLKVDSSTLRGRIKLAIKRAERGLRAKIKIDADTRTIDRLKNKLSRLTRVFRKFGRVTKLLKFGAVLTSAPALANAIVSLSAAGIGLIGVLSRMGGMLATLPGLAAGAAQGFGVLIAAFKGIGGALSAGFAPSAGGGGGGGGLDARARTEGMIRLQRALEDVKRSEEDLFAAIQDNGRSLGDSERQLVDAQERLKNAQMELNNARKDSSEHLAILNDSTKGLAIQEERAIKRVADARKLVEAVKSDPGAIAEDQRDAELSLMEAELALNGVKRQRTRSEEQLAKATKNGIENSVITKTRTRELADAERSIVDIQREKKETTESISRQYEDMTRITQDMSKAEADLAKGMKDSVGGGGGINAYQDALKNLTPSARKFVEQIVKLKPRLAELRKEIQEPVFKGLLVPLDTFINKLLPQLEMELPKTAAVIGSAFADFGQKLGTEAFLEDFSTLLASNTVVTGHFARGMGELGILFVEFGAAAAPLTERVAKGFENTAKSLREMLASKRESGEFTAFLDRTWESTMQIGRVVRDFGVALKNVFSIAAGGIGQSALDNIEDMGKRFREFTESTSGRERLVGWFDRMRGSAGAVATMIGRMVSFFVKLGSGGEGEGFANFISNELLPAITGFFEAAKNSGTFEAFGNVLTSVFGLFTSFSTEGSSMAPFLNFLAGFIDKITWLNKNIPGFSYLLTGILLSFKLLGGKKTLGFVKMLGRMGLAIGRVLLFTNPWITALALLAGVLIVAYTKSDRFRAIIDNLVRIISDFAVGAFQALVRWIDRLADAFDRGGFTGMMQFLGTEIVKGFMAAKSAILENAPLVWNWVQKTIPKLKKQLGKWGAAFASWFASDFWPGLKEQIAKNAPALWGWIKDVTPDVLSALWGMATAVYTWYTETFIPYLRDKAAEYAPVLWQWIKDVTPVVLQKLKEWGIAVYTWFAVVFKPFLKEKLMEAGAWLHKWVMANYPAGLEALKRWGIAVTTWFVVAFKPWLRRTMLDVGVSLYEWIMDGFPSVSTALTRWKIAFATWFALNMVPALAKIAYDMSEALLGFKKHLAEKTTEKLNQWLIQIIAWAAASAKAKLISVGTSIGKSIVEGFKFGEDAVAYLAKLPGMLADKATSLGAAFIRVGKQIGKSLASGLFDELKGYVPFTGDDNSTPSGDSGSGDSGRRTSKSAPDSMFDYSMMSAQSLASGYKNTVQPLPNPNSGSSQISNVVTNNNTTAAPVIGTIEISGANQDPEELAQAMFLEAKTRGY